MRSLQSRPRLHVFPGVAHQRADPRSQIPHGLRDPRRVVEFGKCVVESLTVGGRWSRVRGIYLRLHVPWHLDHRPFKRALL